MKKLTEEQKRILINKGTELPFTGKYLHNKKEGEYLCALCGSKLFSSETKYDSGSGWPSFYRAEKNKIKEEKEKEFLNRTEIMCAKCGSHLGHVFGDGPKPTGLRYCVNSAALNFKKKN